MKRVLLSMIGCIALFGLPQPSQGQPLPQEGPVKPRQVRKIFGDGKHNAFTAFRKWKETYWISFRHAAAHNAGEGEIVLLRSKDAQEWKEAARFNILPDDRDPQFLATEQRLLWRDQLPLRNHCHVFRTQTADL